MEKLSGGYGVLPQQPTRVKLLVSCLLANLYAPISYIYGGNVFIYVKENAQLRHQVTLLNIMEYNAVRLSSTLFGF